MEERIEKLDTYKIEVTGYSANFFIALLVAMVTSLIPMLLNSDEAIFYTSMPFYISVVILFACAMYLRGWSVFASFSSFVLYGLLTEMPIRILTVNVVVNTLQIFLLLLGFIWIKNRKRTNRNKYAKGTFYLSQYNSLLIIDFFLYLAVCIFGLIKYEHTLEVFFILTVAMTLIKIIIEKDFFLFSITFLLISVIMIMFSSHS